MSNEKRNYTGDGITVTYEAKRCIHAAECVHGLAEVFDGQKRPWIQPNNASADAVAEVVQRCPTGALAFSRSDDGLEEEAPAENVVTIQANGPLYLHGALTLETEAVVETRMALCRCGASANKPFCDNQHQQIDFKAHAKVVGGGAVLETSGSVLLKPVRHGPVLFRGPLTIQGENGSIQMDKGALCRCGGSQNKPFCDGTHAHIGFQTE